MANYDLGDFMDRLLEMEKESIDDLVDGSVDGVTYFPYEQESFPYWTNRVTGFVPDYIAQDIAHYPLRIAGRLVMGHLKEGFEGDILKKSYDYLEAVLSYFKDRPTMKSNAHPTKMDDIFTDFEITDIVGPAAFQNNGIGSTQVGLEFVFVLPIIDVQYR
jgi:hypothetical protein